MHNALSNELDCGKHVLFIPEQTKYSAQAYSEMKQQGRAHYYYITSSQGTPIFSALNNGNNLTDCALGTLNQYK